MDYLDEIQRTINYIEAHIKEDISAGNLAALIGFSEKHFYRLFKAYTGMSVMDYVRRRKMIRAIAQLRGGDRILDVALDYGFESHGGFAKAFKKQFGSSPQIYLSHASAALPDPIHLTTQPEKFKIYGGITLEPKITRRPAFRIAGYHIRTDGASSTHDCPALWDRHNIEGWEEKLYAQLQPNGHGEYGVCIENNAQTGEFVYLIGVAVEDFSRVTSDMYRAEIPASDYAVFTTTPTDGANFSKNIQKTWHYILEEWLPASAFAWDEVKPDFEFYDERCHGETDLVMDIYVPVVAR
jgi:AraC family transcriptional regulator